MNISKIFIANSLFATRKDKELEHPFRSNFERDRDRILNSKEFRRLNRKTQVFVSGFDDHIRNRLTHTIEVGQISQTITNHLNLNQTLSQAIAYGHDVGHTPFGHVGERTLNYFMNGCGKYRGFIEVHKDKRGFKHNWQGIRVVMDLEKISNEFDGLNLTNYTLWGILNHTSINPKICEFKNIEGKSKCHFNHKYDVCLNGDNGLSYAFYEQYLDHIPGNTSWTIEGLIVRMADEISQRHHDIEDGLFAKIIDKDEIIESIINYFGKFLTNDEMKRLSDLEKEPRVSIFIYSISSLIINFLVTQLINQTKINLEKLKNEFELLNNHDFNTKKPEIFKTEIFKIVSYPPELAIQEDRFRKFLKSRILNSHIAQSMDGKSTYILRNLISSYLDNPQQLPDNTIYTLYMNLSKKEEIQKHNLYPYEHNIGQFREKLKTDHFKSNNPEYRYIFMRTICDFIAGMTDDFAIKQYNILYGTTNVFNN